MILTATEFKARCLAILERIRATGQTVTVTKRGVPIAEVVPVFPAGRSFQDDLKGTVKIIGDILEPVLPAEAWEAERGAARRSSRARKPGKRRPSAERRSGQR